MKKLFFILTALTLILVACGGNEDKKATEDNNEATDQTEKKEDTETEESGEDEQSIDVDKGLLNVEVTIPTSFFQSLDQDVDQVIADAKDSGVKEVVENSDGSLTYKMSKSQHKEMMNNMAEELSETMKELENSEDFVSIQEVTANKSFTEFTMSVEQEAFENSFDGFAAISLGMSGMFYQLFDGSANPEELKVTIFIKNAESGEIFDTTVYPDDLEETEE